jgi:putative tricarboxylic transport membrane protein
VTARLLRPDVVAGVVTLGLGLLIAVEARRIPDPGMDVIGPGAFPFVLGVMIAACGLGIVLAAVRTSVRAANEEGARWPVLGAALALLVVYAHALAYVGFLLATGVFVAACLALLGQRSPVRIAVAASLVAVIVFAVFGFLLRVDLPLGSIFVG